MTDITYFTSESVSEGHPDKMADQISDAILDALIADDKNSRTGIETLVKTGMVLVSGEVRTDAWVDIEDDLHAKHRCPGILATIQRRAQKRCRRVPETVITRE